MDKMSVFKMDVTTDQSLLKENKSKMQAVLVLSVFFTKYSSLKL